MLLRKIGIPLVVLCLALAVWQVFFTQEKVIDKNEEIPVALTKVASSQNKIKISGEVVAPTVDKVDLTDQDKRDFIDMHKDDVRGGQYQSSDYGTYDISILESLADSGDVKAMKVLALRYLEMTLKDNLSYEEMIKYSAKKNEYTSKAILYGDREMLSAMPELKREISGLESANLTPEEKHNKVLNVLAYYEFMGLRGSMRDKYDGQRLFFKTYSELLGLPSSLSDIDKNSVRARAKEIYDLQEQKRIELGLGVFDNSNSENVLKAYEAQRQLYLSEMGSLAIE